MRVHISDTILWSHISKILGHKAKILTQCLYVCRASQKQSLIYPLNCSREIKQIRREAEYQGTGNSMRTSLVHLHQEKLHDHSLPIEVTPVISSCVTY